MSDPVSEEIKKKENMVELDKDFSADQVKLLEGDLARKENIIALLKARVNQLEKGEAYLSEVVEGHFVCYFCRKTYDFKEMCGLVIDMGNIKDLKACHYCRKSGEERLTMRFINKECKK